MANQVSLKKIVMVLAVAGVAGAAQAATLTTATANATVLTPLSIAENTPMDFGNVGGDKDTPTTVQLDTTGTVTAGAGAYAEGTGAAADFTVSGAAGAAYALTMPASITLAGPGANMTVDSFTYSAGTTSRSLDGTGTDNFQVGATLHIGANQTAGSYTGTYSVTVAYQ